MKRFTETTKWDDPWFLDLPAFEKLLWIYLCDKCDNAGVIDLSLRKAAFELNGMGDVANGLETLGTRIRKLSHGKYFIPAFVRFQYGELKDNNNLHKSVISLVAHHEESGDSLGIAYPSEPSQEGMLRGPSKGKGKGRGKGKGKEERDRRVRNGEEPVLSMPLIGGDEYHLFEDDVAEWEKAFPGVPIMQILQNMRQWCISNPRQSKTATGVRRFITGWLTREKDEGVEATAPAELETA